jgi:membrane protein
MDWLTRLPVVGPLVARAMRTHAWRAFAHLQDVHWTRLAAAMTFTSFLSLFPLLAVVAAAGAATLSDSQLDRLEHKITEQIPGIADQIDVNGLVANAGTIGTIGAAALFFTGLGWVGSLRDCLRAVWRKDNEEQNPVVAKLLDAGVLLGLGCAVLVSLGASGFATAAVNWTADQAGLDRHGAGRVLLEAVGYALAVLADFLILVYLLTLLPGVEPPRRAVVVAALIGAVGFEALKIGLSGYLRGVAGKNIYGAFGTPIALLLWINFMAKLLLYCAAWTATQHGPKEVVDPSDDIVECEVVVEAEPAGVPVSGAPAANGLPGGSPGGAPRGRTPREPNGRPGPAGGEAAPPGPEESADSPGSAGSPGSPEPHPAGAHRWRPPPAGADGGAVRR